MADLMSASFNYAALEAKYGNFVVPAFKIKSMGMDLISTLDLSVIELDITLSLDAAGMVIIKIADAYDLESHSFSSKVKSAFKLGTVMEVEIGYLSFTTSVFKGFVAGVGAEFDEHPLFIVKLMDARYLMKTSGVQRILYNEKNYSDVFKKVMSKYSRLCSVECEATSDKLENPISQSTNDYDFVREELIRKGKSEREFFIFGGKVYFRTPHKNKTPIMTVNYGRELLRFSMMEDYINTVIQVVGYNYADAREITAKATAKSSSLTSVITPAPVQYFIDADADSAAKAKTRAGTIADRLAQEKCAASGEMIGLPEIIPGRYLAVDALDKMADKKYYITEVTHSLSDSRFVTRFEAKGWL
ncbi:MAG: hypothetical protein E7662_02630 [Ruminococcaceae bacterium]|nr:hypothetical protein [Oscillospiraceae bacterium]